MEWDGLRITSDNPSGMCSFTCICDGDMTYLMFNFVLTHEDNLFLYLKLQNKPCVNRDQISGHVVWSMVQTNLCEGSLGETGSYSSLETVQSPHN